MILLQLLCRLCLKFARIGLIVFAFIVLIAMKILQPIVRFRLLVVGFHRFGHLALEPEIYLARSKTDARGVIDLWSLGRAGNRTNEYLASKWSRVVNSQPSWFVGALQRAGNTVPLLALENPKLSIHGPGNALDNSNPHLVFDKVEQNEGRRQLELMGVDCDKPFACLIVRDAGHYLSVGDSESGGYSFLNFDISNFEEAALALASLGCQVIRMGAGTEKPMRLQHPNVFDYAVSEFRNEFMDVFIAGTCSFAISTQTGPDAVCLAVRRPVFYVDVTRFSQFFFGTKIAYWNPAHIYLNKSRLSLREILESPIFWLKDPDDFLKLGVEVVRSSPHELAEMCVAFAEHLLSDSRGLTDWNLTNQRVHQILELGMGERGKLVFGLPTAPLNPLFAIRHGSWFLD